MLEPLNLFASRDSTIDQLQLDGWGPGAVAAGYEDRFYNGNWPRLRRKLEEYKRKYEDDKRKYEDDMKFLGMDSDGYGFHETSPEKQFMNNYPRPKESLCRHRLPRRPRKLSTRRRID